MRLARTFDRMPRMRRLSSFLLAALCVLAAVPAVGQAASLVYLDQGNDVAVARPDGNLARKVTHATDPTHGYKAISVADDGGITAYLSQGDGSGNSSFVVLGPDGAVRSGPFLFERYGICGGLSPFWTATSPDGTFVAVSYWKGSSNCLGGSYTPSVRLTNRTSPTFGTSTYPSYDYLIKPHWLRHPDQRLAGIDGNALQVWQNDAAHMQDWITVSGDSSSTASTSIRPKPNSSSTSPTPPGADRRPTPSRSSPTRSSRALPPHPPIPRPTSSAVPTPT